MSLRTHIDFETRSLVDLRTLGADVYARHWSTAPLMLTFGTAPKGVRPKFDLIDFFEVPGYAQAVYPSTPFGQRSTFKVPCPQLIIDAIARGDTFVAHNARFEQTHWYNICHLMWGWPMPVAWSCTAARSRYFGIRASLDGSASDLEVVAQKDARGKEFIDNFCKPRKYKGPKRDGIVKELWYEPHQNPEGWRVGKEYCITDGEAECDIDSVLPDLPPFEQEVWEWDFQINNRGIPIDVKSVQRAKEFSEYFTRKAVDRFEQVTSLRPTQRERVLEYLQQREEIEDLGDLRSKTLKRLVKTDFPEDLRDIIDIRLDCSLASIKKLDRMEKCADDDDNARGCHLYGGAHTMRWSHKRIQTGNLKRGDADMQAAMFRYLEGRFWEPQLPVGFGSNGGPSAVDLLGSLEAPPQPQWVIDAGMRFLRPLASLSVSMRGFIWAGSPDQVIRECDFAQIEARVLAWLAREEWLLEAFRNKLDPYVKFFSDYMYPCEYEDCFEYVNGKRKVKKEFALKRQISKSAVLGAGFGIGAPKFVEYCDNSDLIISLEDAQATVGAYRESNPNIMRLHQRAESAAILAVANPGQVYEIGGTGVKFYIWAIDEERYWLAMEFPSGRCMYYYRPKIQLQQKWGRTKETLTFRTEWNGKSYRESTYGGKIVENMVQGIARDMLCVGGLKIEKAGYPVIMLNHDACTVRTPRDFGSHEHMCELMCEREPWYTDMPIEAEGATMERYGAK